VKPRKSNVGLDNLSRIETGEEPISIKDNMPDAHLFVIRVADDHFADIIFFLATGMAPTK